MLYRRFVNNISAFHTLFGKVYENRSEISIFVA